MSTSASPPRAVVVVVTPTPRIQQLLAALHRELPVTEAASMDVLRGPPEFSMYMWLIAARMAAGFARDIATWASTLRPGLVAVIEDGDIAEREGLLEIGFDDVITSPIGARELAVRLRALHR